MANITKPADINKIWASAGDVLAPADAKIALGWQVEIPARQFFNYIDNKQDQAIAHINQHGIAVWDGLTEYQAGTSYTQGSNGIVYRAITTHSGQNPVTDTIGTYWAKVFSGLPNSVKIYNAVGTFSYIPTTGTTKIKVRMSGAGGGGGGAGVSSSSTVSIGAGGGAGGFAEFLINSPAASYSLSVGAGGAGGTSAPTNGGNGSSTSFGGVCTCTGGIGGIGQSAISTSFTAQGGSAGTVSTSTGPVFILTLQGSPGACGFSINTAAAISGSGGASGFGSGGGISRSGANQIGAVGIAGSGGGGGFSINSPSTGYQGGAGGAGLIIIEEYN